MHALATPLLTKADGSKFGKTETGTIWLDPEMTSPYAFHQFFLNAEDEKVVEYLKVFSERSREEIAELERQTRRGTASPRGAEGAGRRRHRPGAFAGRAGCSGRRRRRRSSAAPISRAVDESTLASVVAELGGAELARPRRLPSVVEVLERSGVVRQQGGGPTGDRRGRRVPQQRAGHRSGRATRARRTCCTAAT